MTLSIKKKIVLWYTLWIVLLVSLVIIFFFSGSSYLMERRSRSLLTEKVHDAADEIESDDGVIEIDDDVKAFDEGVYIAVYDESGTLIFGRSPSSVSLHPFTEGRIETVDSDYSSWYVYDVVSWLSEDTAVHIRGAMRVQDMSIFYSSLETYAFLLALFLAILSSFGGYIIVSRSFRPADDVIRTAGEIAESKDLSKRIGLGDGNGEIHQMAAAFDKMLLRLEEAFEKERQFSNDASHELRTPISVILAECGYARTHMDDCEKMRESIDAIENQATRMSRLVSMLLSIARSDKGTLQPKLSDVDISELAQIVLETMEEKADEKGVNRLNIVNINYNREGGMAVLDVHESGNDVMINVRDNGIGISENDIRRIWDRFFQADSSRNTGGAGLGLPIVQILVNAHGGSVSVESQEGEGSIFSVRIPKKR